MAQIKCRCLRFYKYGDPTVVVHHETIDVSTNVKSNEVLVRWLATPINPADINIIENVYWKKRALGSFACTECVGVVEKVKLLIN